MFNEIGARCTVVEYGRTARRRVCRERRGNGNELAGGADGAHCRRSFIRCWLSSIDFSLFTSTHTARTRTLADLGWHERKRCGKNEGTSGLLNISDFCWEQKSICSYIHTYVHTYKQQEETQANDVTLFVCLYSMLRAMTLALMSPVRQKQTRNPRI